MIRTLKVALTDQTVVWTFAATCWGLTLTYSKHALGCWSHTSDWQPRQHT